MLTLTREVGRPVLTAQCERIGSVHDLTATLGAVPPVVRHVVVALHGGGLALVPWARVTAQADGALALRSDPGGERVGGLATVGAPVRGVHDLRPALRPDELLLVRDVLDTQVVDVAGHRSGRVCEVLLQRRDGDLQVSGVDLGAAALCRRLGLGLICDALPDRVVAWSDLHLRSAPGHAAQLAAPASAVHRLDAHALAELLTRLDVASGAQVLTAVGADHAAAAVVEVHPEVAVRIVRALPPQVAEGVLAALPPEHASRYRRVRAAPVTAAGRRFLRTRGWRLHRPARSGTGRP